ncbi:hypothetical protein F5J12DRAFT_897703 [Pisolithus orientalis]|uniref:uncharacterized protein n=1 Tax=Pisolithus orientalis TaxID=936130 RepID=UPI002224C1F0|nr:uncharacterized protein F5J12DRAFT_897703 [Pisolithus orientalis]KAI5990558.1 hypothetical protein F5J12DRAFT_897703 [Pisolithus orientalis]
MNLNGCSQSALTNLNDPDAEGHQWTIASTSSHSREGNSDLAEVLRSIQLQLDIEKSHNWELLEKNAVLEANKTHHSMEDIPADVIVYNSEIKTLGKTYAVMMEMFLPQTPLTNTMSELPKSPSPMFATAEHYASRMVEEQGLVTELDSILPEHLHRIRNTHFFLDVFAQAMQSGQSDILYKLCDNAHKTFALPKNHFSPNASHLKVPEITKMLGVKDIGTPNQHFTIWFPFLFKDMKLDVHKLFMNWKLLAQILKGALWGKMSLTEGFVHRGGPKMNGQKWQVIAVTPGSIAWAATMCMFLLSPDKEFPGNGCGAISKIDYYQVFCAYKQVLITKWTDHHIQKIVMEMNHFVFGNPGAAMKSRMGAMEDFSVEIDAVMAAMDSAALSEDDADKMDSSGLSTPDLLSITDTNIPAASESHQIVTSVPVPVTTLRTSNNNSTDPSSTDTLEFSSINPVQKSKGQCSRGRHVK